MERRWWWATAALREEEEKNAKLEQENAPEEQVLQPKETPTRDWWLQIKRVFDLGLQTFSNLFRWRISRWEFLIGTIMFNVLIIPLMIFIMLQIGPGASSMWAMHGVMIILFIVILLITFNHDVKRLHDIDTTWRVALLKFIPVVNIIVSLILICKKWTAWENRFWEDSLTRQPKNNWWYYVLGALLIAWCVWVLALITASVNPWFNKSLWWSWKPAPRYIQTHDVADKLNIDRVKLMVEMYLLDGWDIKDWTYCADDSFKYATSGQTVTPMITQRWILKECAWSFTVVVTQGSVSVLWSVWLEDTANWCLWDTAKESASTKDNYSAIEWCDEEKYVYIAG